jgi:hypothetical protein
LLSKLERKTMSNKETLEEAAERLYPNGCDGTDRSAEIYRRILIEGAKFQTERMYSEIHLILENVLYWDTCPDDFKEDIKKWLNDYKQKQ